MSKEFSSGVPTLVLDGHDGAGKSTLAAVLAQRTGGQVVKPFADTLGDHIAWLWRKGSFAEANSLALSSVVRVLDGADGGPLIFDRHWATMFSVLPESCWPDWEPLPPTVICETDPECTMARLTERGEERKQRSWHAHFIRSYHELAIRYGTMIIDTSYTDAEAAADAVCARFADQLEPLAPARTASGPPRHEPDLGTAGSVPTWR